MSYRVMFFVKHINIVERRCLHRSLLASTIYVSLYAIIDYKVKLVRWTVL